MQPYRYKRLVYLFAGCIFASSAQANEVLNKTEDQLKNIFQNLKCDVNNSDFPGDRVCRAIEFNLLSDNNTVLILLSNGTSHTLMLNGSSKYIQDGWGQLSGELKNKGLSPSAANANAIRYTSNADDSYLYKVTLQDKKEVVVWTRLKEMKDRVDSSFGIAPDKVSSTSIDLSPSAQTINAQYLSDAEAKKKEAEERNAKRQSKIDAIVGKTYWYRPGNPDLSRTEFYENIKVDRIGSWVNYNFTGRFYLTKETSFKVLAADFKGLKVEFEDGKIAYLKSYILAEHGDYSLIENLYPGRQRANSSQAYIYPEAPFKIDNPAPFFALDSIIGKKFWYLPKADANDKLNFVGEVKSNNPFIIDSYTISSDTINIKLRFDDGSSGFLRISKYTFSNFSGTDLPFVYISKDKYVPTREYLYPGPPNEVIAAEEAAYAARTAATAQEKAVAAEERSRARKDAIAVLTKELKGAPRSFEVRGLNLGRDHYLDVNESKGFVNEKGSQVEGFPDTRKEESTDGGRLYFYHDVLFMAIYEDLQDTVEIRAAMNQLEAKFKGKFASIQPHKSRDGNIETTTGGFRMNIGNTGVAEVRLVSTKPVDKRACVNDIAREMRQRLDLGLKNYSSLTDRVERECVETLNPTQIVFINKPIEAIVNSRAATERQRNARQAAEERIKAASEKAKMF